MTQPEWRVSQAGNDYMAFDGFVFILKRNEFGGYKLSININDEFGTLWEGQRFAEAIARDLKLGMKRLSGPPP